MKATAAIMLMMVFVVSCKKSVSVSGSIEGHEYVDLGLPSGTLWATCNMGANVPEDYGDYFAWGEFQPKETYNWINYKYCIGDGDGVWIPDPGVWDDIYFTKYCTLSSLGNNGYTDNLTTLLPEDDAATANWGSDWCTPTKNQWQELIDNTTSTWTTQNGVNGRLFKASNGRSLFLPAAGRRYYSSYDAGSWGLYWSSSLYSDVPYFAFDLVFGLYTYEVGNKSRDCGIPVRPVCSSRQN